MMTTAGSEHGRMMPLGENRVASSGTPVRCDFTMTLCDSNDPSQGNDGMDESSA
jgi:hypothetical protein